MYGTNEGSLRTVNGFHLSDHHPLLLLVGQRRRRETGQTAETVREESILHLGTVLETIAASDKTNFTTVEEHFLQSQVRHLCRFQ